MLPAVEGGQVAERRRLGDAVAEVLLSVHSTRPWRFARAANWGKMDTKPIRVIVADDHALVRSALRRLLEPQADIEVVAEAGDGRSALHLALEHQPDVVLMDVAMSGMNGVDATERLAAEAPDVKVLALSAHSEQRIVKHMLSAGACGYMPKGAEPEELFYALRRVAAGRTYLGGDVAASVLAEYVQRLRQEDGSVLSVREREVLQLIAEGHSVKLIASRLGVSGKTIESHRAHIMTKLGLRSVAALTKYAIREGITPLSD